MTKAELMERMKVCPTNFFLFASSMCLLLLRGRQAFLTAMLPCHHFSSLILACLSVCLSIYLSWNELYRNSRRCSRACMETWKKRTPEVWNAPTKPPPSRVAAVPAIHSIYLSIANHFLFLAYYASWSTLEMSMDEIAEKKVEVEEESSWRPRVVRP